MSEIFYIVTGAPGAGKTEVAKELLKRKLPILIYDIDWLTEAGSRLSGKDVVSDSSIWSVYRMLWVEIIRMAHENDKQAVLFAAIDKDDISELGQDIAERTQWCLLGCSDQIRRGRLSDRSKWTDAMLEEAINDAEKLRKQISNVIKTDTDSVAETSNSIQDWLTPKGKRI